MSVAAPQSKQFDPLRDVPPPPRAIAEAAAEADRLQREAIAEANGGEPPAEAMQEVPPPVAQEPPAPPPQAPAPQHRPEDGSWEHRYNSAMGRLQASESRERQMVERLNHMESLLAGIQAGRAAEPSAQPAKPNYSKLVTDDEERDYGEEFMGVVERKAKDALLPEILILQDQMKDLQTRVSTVGTTIAKSGEEKVWTKLIERVPDAEAMNNDQGFLQWLGAVDPYSGAKRSDMLAQAYARQDAQRVINFFTGYKAEQQATDPQRPAPAPAPQSGRPALQDFAAPGRGASSPPQAANEKPIYSARDLANFYENKRRGFYRGREAEADAIERDIFLAQGEGRIR